MDITRVDALARKAKRRGLAKTIPSMLEITEDHDESTFKPMRDPSHCKVYTIYYPQYGLTLLEGLGLEDTPTLCLK